MKRIDAALEALKVIADEMPNLVQQEIDEGKRFDAAQPNMTKDAAIELLAGLTFSELMDAVVAFRAKPKPEPIIDPTSGLSYDQMQAGSGPNINDIW